MKKRIFQIGIAISIFSIALTEGNAQVAWTKKTNFGGTTRWGAVGFSIGTKAYIGLGVDVNGLSKEFWEWDQTTNVWTRKADFGGEGRYQAVAFSIGNKGYIGTGAAGFTYPYGPIYKDFWEWDQATNVWTKKADFGGGAIGAATGFSIGSKGYIGTGLIEADTSQGKLFWEWDQATDVWTKKADFGGEGRSDAVGFSIGGKGYLGTGEFNLNTFYKDFWEYDPVSNQWLKKADFGGEARCTAAGFSIGGQGYIGLGGNFGSAEYRDFWGWDQATDVWTKKADFGALTRWLAVGFSIGSNGYIATGGNFRPTYKDLWEYNPSAPQGLDEFNLPVTTISILPNPSNGKFVLNSSELKIQYLEAYNLQGKKVYAQEISAYSIPVDLNAQANGVYLLRITSEKEIITKKIIVE